MAVVAVVPVVEGERKAVFHVLLFRPGRGIHRDCSLVPHAGDAVDVAGHVESVADAGHDFAIALGADQGLFGLVVIPIVDAVVVRPGVVGDFGEDLLSGLICSSCNEEETLFGSLGKVTEAQGICPRCRAPRTPRLLRTIDGKDANVLDRTFGAIGAPAWDIVGGRVGGTQRYFEFQGDREAVLRGLAP